MLLNKEKDMIIMIDMINGFSYIGNFASNNIINLSYRIKKFLDKNIPNNVHVIHYVDAHLKNDMEFKTYPIHCLKDSDESKVIKCLDYSTIEIIHKNCTNGFLTFNPFVYQKNIYIIGCVTDICIFEFALTAQKYKEQNQLPYSVNVISDLVDTFDAKDHDAKEINSFYLNILKQRGINII